MSRATTFVITAAALVVLAATAFSVFNSDDPAGSCTPDLIFTEGFDDVVAPALPDGWAATNAIDPDRIFWVTSNSGDPSPPADSPPNAAFVNDPSAISDKRLDSPRIFEITGESRMQVTFRNNFILQDGFDGAVLEISVDGGNTFQDILMWGTFVTGGYNGTISDCYGNPLAGRQAWDW